VGEGRKGDGRIGGVTFREDVRTGSGSVGE